MLELITHLFTIGVAGQSRTTILLCSGRMVQGSIELLRGALTAATETEAPVVEVDLSKVSQIDRCAAAALLQTRHELARQGRELRLVVNPQTEALLRRLGAAALLYARMSDDADLSRLSGDGGNEEATGLTYQPERDEQ
jgi:anti-anti-sigma regulatory factor